MSIYFKGNKVGNTFAVGTKPTQTKTATPTTSQQLIEPDSGYELSSVTVNAVTSSIDANIQSSNIKDGVNMLGVACNVVEYNPTRNETVTPSTTQQTISNSSANQLDTVVIDAVNLEVANVSPTTSSQQLTPSGSNLGFSQVNVDAVTSSIDANITAENIKNGVNILGVTGNYQGSGAHSVIMVAELPNVSLSIKNSSGVVLDTKNTGSAGGVVIFSVSGNGTYTVTATNTDGTELWTNDIVVDGVGTYNCKTGKALNDYTWAEINTASTGGYAKYMWSVGDGKTFVSTDSIFNNYEFIIIGFGHDTLASDGVSKAGITFMMKKCYTGSTYNINTKIYVNGSSVYRNYGGYRASQIRQRFQAQGESCYSQATSVTADILASGFKYFDNSICPIYSYTESTDTFADATGETFNTGKVYYVKGYYKSVGTIEEGDFVSNKYFTYSSSTYSLATEWVDGTTYYCLYPTLQENGVFYNALQDLIPYIKTVKKKQNTGGSSSNLGYLSETEEKIWMLCAEEIWGVNKTSISFQGSMMYNANFSNSAGEGTMYEYFKNNFQFSKIASADSRYIWWTRSPYTNNYYYWHVVSSGGYIANYEVQNSKSVRPCFCI